MPHPKHPLTSEIDALIGAGDELMGAIGKLRKIDPEFPCSPLAKVLDRVLDVRSRLMEQKKAGKTGKAVPA